MLWGWVSSLEPGGAALLGALIGALVAYGLRELEEVRRRGRELEGLLRLLELETRLNEEVIDAYRAWPRDIGNPERRRVSTRAFDDASVRLAQLLKDADLLKDLAEYYEDMRALAEYARIPEDKVTSVFKAEVLKEWLPRLEALNGRVRPRLADRGHRSWWKRTFGNLMGTSKIISHFFPERNRDV